MTDTVPKAVEAERFVLRDRDGGIRVILTTGREGDGLPRFSTEPLGPWGKPLVGTDDNPALLFIGCDECDEKATLRARLSMGPGGWPELDLGDEKGTLRVRLLVDNVGNALLLFLDDAGRSSAALGWSSDSGPKLRIGDLVMDAGYAKFLRWLPALVGAALFGSLAPLVTRLF